MENIRKMHELLKDRPELQKKITGEASLLVENNEAGEKEALARAVKASLDIDLTEEELDTLFAKAAELDPEETVCIIESAYPKAFSPEVTYTVAVYSADVSGAEDPAGLTAELEGLSKSKAAAREELSFLFREDYVLTGGNAREPEKGREAQ